VTPAQGVDGRLASGVRLAVGLVLANRVAEASHQRVPRGEVIQRGTAGRTSGQVGGDPLLLGRLDLPAGEGEQLFGGQVARVGVVHRGTSRDVGETRLLFFL
jgi:hypothetical protein